MKVVVIVEDEVDVAVMQKRLLEPYTTRVDIVTDRFYRALEVDLWAGVDVAIVDLMLPGVRGETICEYLRDTMPSIRRVICTAKPAYELPALEGLAHVILTKPFDQADFVHAVLGSDV